MFQFHFFMYTICCLFPIDYFSCFVQYFFSVCGYSVSQNNSLIKVVLLHCVLLSSFPKNHPGWYAKLLPGLLFCFIGRSLS